MKAEMLSLNCEHVHSAIQHGTEVIAPWPCRGVMEAQVAQILVSCTPTVLLSLVPHIFYFLISLLMKID